MDADLPLLSSSKSQVLKRVRAVRAGKERALVCLEGERLIRDAVGAGVALELLLCAAEEEPLKLSAGARYACPGALLQQVSGLRTSPGYLALAEKPRRPALEELSWKDDALLLVVDGVADPGNLGALARSSEAAGAQALACLPGGAQPFGEKALRGSMGSLLRLPVVDASEALVFGERLTELGFRNVRAATRGGAAWRNFDWSGRIALWVSGETGEPPAGERVQADGVTIPMAPGVESLNVTVAASLLLFAAGRSEDMS